MKTVALIINYNRLGLMKQTADWCAEHGLLPIIVDNNSTSLELLEFYKETDFTVIKMQQNWGHKIIWNSNDPLVYRLNLTRKRYIVTDPDLDYTGIPDDFLEVLNFGLDHYPQYPKCGFSIEINDLPNEAKIQDIKEKCEAPYWTRPLGKGYFIAPIDTTFALYREGVVNYTQKAIRTDRPYTVRHIPWYYTDLAQMNQDEQNYFKSAGESSSNKWRFGL